MEKANRKKTIPDKSRKLKLKKVTIKDLKTPDKKSEKIKGGFMNDTGSDYCCDRNLKSNFAPADVKQILTRLLEVPIQKWNYKSDEPSVAHIGPMAQDFATAFGLGKDDKHIHAVDADGVAFAAIQALFHMIGESDAEMNSLRSGLNDVRAQVKP
jgi:Chaperone of endosialidase